MARVYKGNWNGDADWWCGDYVDAAGKRRRVKLARTKGEANILLDEIKKLEREKKRQGVTLLEPLFLVALCDEFIRAKEEEGLSPKSIRRYKVSIKVLKEEFGGLKVMELNRVHVGRYKKKRVRQVEKGTVNREHACGKHMYVKAIEWGYAEKNPFKEVPLFDEYFDVDRSLKSTKLKVLLAACPAYLKWLVLFTLCTGLRESEVLSLKWSMLDENLQVKKRKWRISLSTPLGRLAKAVLGRAPRYPGCDYVFPDEHGKPFVKYDAKGELFVRRVFNRRWKIVVEESGILEDKDDEFRFHDLRHTTGTWLARLGCNAFQIKRIMGIKNIKTAERYIHLSGADLVEPTNRLNDFIGGLMGKNTDIQNKAEDNLLELVDLVQSDSEKKPDKVGNFLAIEKVAV